MALTQGQKAARTQRLKQAGMKAAATRRRRAAGKKAAKTRIRRVAARKAAATRKFSHWEVWPKRAALANLARPGIYALAISLTDIAATPFSWRREIVYIGMTNAKGGLKSRLQQFDNTIKGKEGHGGGRRFRFKHPDYVRLTSQLYVSVYSWDCNVTSNNPADLRIMGEVVRHEYECWALFVEAFGKLPEFNDKKKSPKR